MIQLLIDNPLLLLFLVAAVGYLLGRINLGGLRLGIAAVLFVGIAVGGLHPDLKLPEIVANLGLVLFVYTVGLSNGPVFFASFRGSGLRDNLIVIAILLGATGLAALAHSLLNLKATQTAGLFVGSLNNTAALAGVLEYIKTYTPLSGQDAMLNETIIGFSITFPLGVVGTILSINLMRRFWKVDYAQEARNLRGAGSTGSVSNRTLRLTRSEAALETVHELIHNHPWDIIIGRVKRNGNLFIVNGNDHLIVGDLVSVVGRAEDLDAVSDHLGEVAEERLDLDRSEFDFRRIFVSSQKVAGHRLKELNLPQQYSAVVTRIRRGDVEIVPHGETVLELGDRVRVVTRRENMPALSTLFGDSYRAISEIDILTFSLGLAMGLLVGIIPFPLPGGITVRLGFAGGPLIMALILGARGRTGPIVWNLPYSVNLVLRQFGLILFLAAVGTRAGYAFFTTLNQNSTLPIFLAGGLITFMVSLLSLWIGYRFLKIPLSMVIGMLAGIQTQPAALSYALEQTGNDLPNIGYANVYPTALICKILLAQVLLTLSL
jgi:putative transport protein